MSGNSILLPGDSIVTEGRLGPGLKAAGDNVALAIVPGELEVTSRATFLESDLAKRYAPSKGDFVIGTITQRAATSYRVSLQPQSKPVRLDHLAFENASRKNRPQLQVGDVVYARVSSCGDDQETEIECFDGSTGKAAGFGPLDVDGVGTIITVNLGYARRLLFKGHPVLDAIGSKYAYECAIGLNGKIWVRGPDVKATLQICQQIIREQNVDEDADGM